MVESELPLTREISSLCVYCASSPGLDPGFADAASAFGRLLVKGGIRLVYGGAHVGLMGVLADAVLGAGGEAHGVITKGLHASEVAHLGLSSLTVVETMHDRKAAMADLSDGFVMMPGGFGTLDEFMEAVTWTQLGIHAKPCGVLNVGGYFDSLLAFLEVATTERFMRPEHRDIVVVESEPEVLMDRLRSWIPPTVEKWLDRTER